MRSRNIKPGFFQNDALGVLSPHARLMFIGLWCIADYQGNLEHRPMKIKGLLFPYENVDPVPYLDELLTSQFIQEYSDGDGKQYLHITNFTTHQSPHINEKKRGTKIPNISGSCPNTVQEPAMNGAKTEPVELIPDSCSPLPDTGLLIGDSMEESQQSCSPHTEKLLKEMFGNE